MALSWLIAGAVPATSTQAFSDPTAYPDVVTAGGGGGRWFTGSPADGFGCDVCHLGGKPAELVIQGLPLEGFVPGSNYEVSLTWPATAEGISLVAEFSDESRQGAGTLSLPREDVLREGERCAMDEGGGPAAGVIGFDPMRQLVAVIDCGAKFVRFQWTAPSAVASRIWFNAGFVSANEDALPVGDGVTMVRQPLAVAGMNLGTRSLTEGCSVRSPSGGWSWLSAVALALGGVGALRRYRWHGEAS